MQPTLFITEPDVARNQGVAREVPYLIDSPPPTTSFVGQADYFNVPEETFGVGFVLELNGVRTSDVFTVAYNANADMVQLIAAVLAYCGSLIGVSIGCIFVMEKVTIFVINRERRRGQTRPNDSTLMQFFGLDKHKKLTNEPGGTGDVDHVVAQDRELMVSPSVLANQASEKEENVQTMQIGGAWCGGEEGVENGWGGSDLQDEVYETATAADTCVYRTAGRLEREPLERGGVEKAFRVMC
mmetsp:Transcript_70155/g.165051  ORF Transcript_70155/g.165051 Transcript_70155/m.165051 type:complete len:241 (+) Transcript_70155:416-1138(+)